MAAWGFPCGAPCGGPGQRTAPPLPGHGALRPGPAGPGPGVLGDRPHLPAAHRGGHGGRGGPGERSGRPHLRQLLVRAAVRPGDPHCPGHPGGLLHPAGPPVDRAESSSGGDLRADGPAGGVGEPDPGHPLHRPAAAGALPGLPVFPGKDRPAGVPPQLEALSALRRHHRHGAGLEVRGGRRGPLPPPAGCNKTAGLPTPEISI